MRDIRADLRERLEAAQDAEQAARDRVRLLKQMLEAEEARMAVAPTLGTSNVTVTGAAAASGNGTATLLDAVSALHEAASKAINAPPIPLDDFLVKAVRRGVHDKEELRDTAIRGGYFPNTSHSPGRVVHAKLTNLVRSGVLAYEDPSKGDRFIMGGN
jgi:hypothetical protein